MEKYLATDSKYLKDNEFTLNTLTVCKKDSPTWPVLKDYYVIIGVAKNNRTYAMIMKRVKNYAVCVGSANEIPPSYPNGTKMPYGTLRDSFKEEEKKTFLLGKMGDKYLKINLVTNLMGKDTKAIIDVMTKEESFKE